MYVNSQKLLYNTYIYRHALTIIPTYTLQIVPQAGIHTEKKLRQRVLARLTFTDDPTGVISAIEVQMTKVIIIAASISYTGAESKDHYHLDTPRCSCTIVV